MKRDIIIIMDGGSLRGIFGAGVLTAFQNLNLYPRIHSFYGRSAGAHNGAYFIAGKTHCSEWMYTQKLTSKKFMRMDKSLSFAAELFLKLFNKKEHIEKLINLDYVKYMEQTMVKLDINKIKKSPIKFYVKVFDIKDGKGYYIDAKKDTLKAIEASAALVPFYPHTVMANGRKYADGNTIINELIPEKELFEIAENNKDKKIVFIINERINPFVIFRNILFNFGWGVSLGMFLGKDVFLKKMKNMLRYDLTRKFISLPNVHLLANDTILHTAMCTNKEVLRDTYREGMRKGRELIKEVL